LGTAWQIFKTAIADQGFAHLEDFRQARRSASEMNKLDQEITAHGQSLRAASERLERARAAAASGSTPIDLAPFEHAVRDAQAAREFAVRESATCAGELTQLDAALARLAETCAALIDLERDYATCGKLAEAANGKNPRRVTFQRYVLGWLLDEVLAAASVRLRVMSKGRYTLQRAAEPGSSRGAGGLDLEVLDAHTGTPRAVATLSGGEGFLASLALALGLADVVQAKAGGIRLQTMFVDEGFGTLDPEALDLAIRSLLDLQHGGRLVGIISHVPELRERIDARLEIATERHGSHARFVVG
jgi:exonuclease SbcC